MSIANASFSRKNSTVPGATLRKESNMDPASYVDPLFEAINADASNYGSLDVMLSIHCGSMEESALWLKGQLEARGVSVWVCTSELQGGDNYRDGIFQAVKSCRVLIPFVNQQWCNSGECEHEFLLAIRTNLISHDSNKTSRTIQVPAENGSSSIPGIRRPAFLPIKFPNCTWSAKPAVEQLGASTNFVVCDADSLLDVQVQPLLLPKLFNALRNLGIRINYFNSDPTPLPLTKKMVQNATTPVELAKQVIAGIQFQLQNAQDLFTMVSRSNAGGSMHDAQFFAVFARHSLRNRYLGYCANEREGCEVIWSMEFVIELGDAEDATGTVVSLTGTMTARPESVTEVCKTPESIKSFKRFSHHVAKEHSAIATLKGRFFRSRGVVLLDAQHKDDPEDLIRLCKYRIVLENGSDSSEIGKRALGLFNPIGVMNENEWSAVIRLVST
ncbi:hypothetical protein BC830DRAFT_1170292 [Chytriomyces sp. MP71]|nr:hypothetical protein BC830DRAFT_1170292 [Chytriomyces sp. MP71]